MFHGVVSGTTNNLESRRRFPATPMKPALAILRISHKSLPRSMRSHYRESDKWTRDGRRHQGSHLLASPFFVRVAGDIPRVRTIGGGEGSS